MVLFWISYCKFIEKPFSAACPLKTRPGRTGHSGSGHGGSGHGGSGRPDHLKHKIQNFLKKLVLLCPSKVEMNYFTITWFIVLAEFLFVWWNHDFCRKSNPKYMEGWSLIYNVFENNWFARRLPVITLQASVYKPPRFDRWVIITSVEKIKFPFKRFKVLLIYYRSFTYFYRLMNMTFKKHIYILTYFIL